MAESKASGETQCVCRILPLKDRDRGSARCAGLVQKAQVTFLMAVCALISSGKQSEDPSCTLFSEHDS